MPVWFLIALAVCGCFALATALRAFRSDGFYIAGERVGRGTVILASIVILIAFAIFAAVQLGFVKDHAP